MPRRTRGGLAQWLRDTATPVSVVDARRVVLFFNSGCEELTGWLAEDVVGRTGDFASEPSRSGIEALLCALCPRPDALTGEVCSLSVEVPHRDGHLLPRTAVYIPLPADRNQPLRVLCAWLPEGSLSQRPELVRPAQLHTELARLREQLHQQYRLEHVIARSPAMHRVLAQVRAAIESGVHVHLSGPAGSGREHLARVIHLQSSQRQRPFVSLDCGRLSSADLRDTLQRALLPADSREGSSSELLPGTILLRDMTRLPRDGQQVLVDHLSFRADQATAITFYSLDSEPLSQAVDEDRLLPELFYLLTTITIDVPALCDRVEDIAVLAQYFLERQNRQGDRQLTGFSPEVVSRLRQYNWPGQVRELRQVVEESHASAAASYVQEQDLPFRFRTGEDAQRTSPGRPSDSIDLEGLLRQVESQEIRRALVESRENRAEAARRLGLTRTKLYRRMEQLGIDSGVAATRADE
ncbi:MAG: sigma 54-interacting transcriptional regulator [Planctomycetaceae bacterium]